MSLDSFHVVPPASHTRASKIALLGFGTVGSAVARRLTAARRCAYPRAHAHRRSPRRPQARSSSPTRASSGRRVSTNPDARHRHRGRSDRRPRPGDRLDPACAAAGKSVVTANKQVIAHHGAALLDARGASGTSAAIRSSGRRGDADRPCRGDGLAGDRITRVVAHPQRHHQRRPVADGVQRLLARRRAR